MAGSKLRVVNDCQNPNVGLFKAFFRFWPICWQKWLFGALVSILVTIILIIKITFGISCLLIHDPYKIMKDHFWLICVRIAIFGHLGLKL